MSEKSAGLLQFSNRIRFPSDLEKDYRTDYNLKIMRISRPGTILAILTYLSFWILDWFVLPQAYLDIWLVRIVGILSMAILLGISYTSWYKRYVTELFTIACLLVNLSVVISFALTHPNEIVYNLYYITLIFVILGAPMLGLPFLAEIILSAITLAAYLLAAIYIQHMLAAPASTGLLIGCAFFLLGAIAIGIVGAYFGEINNRRDFLQRLVIEQEHARSENLLLNILPAPVAERLKRGETIADYYPSVSVLFADIVNFTPLSASMTPVELVDLLNQVFSYFDSLVEKYDLEKIKTIGDCYMAASGLPTPRPDHAQALVKMALEIQAYFAHQRFQGDKQLAFRIGIHSGPLVAGIIGKKKFIYDLWGDSVNTASRMEAHGKQGTIQITKATFDLIKDDYRCKPLGKIDVKGKGEMEVWSVDNLKPANAAELIT
jgi:adenylate cyclase